MDELAKSVGFAVIFAGLFAFVWRGVYLLRAKGSIPSGVSAVLVGALGLAIYGWFARGFYIMNEFELERLQGGHYGFSQSSSQVERAREHYYVTGDASRYEDDKGALRTFTPSREDRIRRESHVARTEGARRGMHLSGFMMSAAVAALPLAILGGLVWPRRPLAPPRAAAGAAPPRRWYQVTLIEVIIVVAIIGVLAAVAKDPSDWNLAAGSTVRNAAVRLELLKPQIAEFRRARNAWPEKNADLGLPEAGYVAADHHYSFQLQGDGGVLLKTRWGDASFRPAVDAKGEIAWLCAHEPAPAGFRVVGENRTTLPKSHLPGECRAR